MQYLGSRNPTALNTPINHEAGPSLDWVAWTRNIAVERACCFVGSEWDLLWKRPHPSADSRPTVCCLCWVRTGEQAGEQLCTLWLLCVLKNQHVCLRHHPDLLNFSAQSWSNVFSGHDDHLSFTSPISITLTIV